MGIDKLLEIINDSETGYMDKVWAISNFGIENILSQRIETVKEILETLKVEDRRNFLSEMPDDYLKDNPELYVMAIESRGKLMKYAPMEIQKMTIEKNIDDILAKFPFMLTDISDETLRENPQICMNLVKKISEVKKNRAYNGKSVDYYYNKLLKYIPEELQLEDKDVMSKLVKGNYKLVAYLCKDLQMEHINECMEYVSKIKGGIAYIHEDIPKQYPDMYRKAIECSAIGLSYIPLEVQMQLPEAFEELVKNSPEELQRISKEIQIKYPNICKLAMESLIEYKRESRYGDYYYLNEQNENCYANVMDVLEWTCEEVKLMDNKDVYDMFMLAINDNSYSISVMNKEVQMSNIDVIKKALENNVELFGYLALDVMKNFPEICEMAVSQEPMLLKRIPIELQEENSQMCINMLKQNIEVYRWMDPKIRDSYEIQNWMFKNVERINKIKNKSYFEIEKTEMDILYHKMIMTIGFDEIERFLHVPNLTEEQIENFSTSYKEKFNEMFERAYKLKGELNAVVEIFRLFSFIKYSFNGKNIRFEIFKNINKNLEEDNDLTLEELIKKSIEQSQLGFDDTAFLQQIVDNKGSIIANLADERLQKVDDKLNQKIEEANIDYLVREPVKVIIEKIIRKNIISNDGALKTDEVIEELKNEIEKKNQNGNNIYSPHIRSAKNEIIEIAEKFLENENVQMMLSKTIIDILRETKEKVGQGWIRKLQEVPLKLNKREYDSLKRRLGINVEAEQLLVVKDNIQEKEALKVLSQIDIPDVLTTQKVELMFSKVEPPYLEEFKKYYKQHRNEILSRPEVYSKFSEIHNRFQEIINSEELMTTYESGKLTVDKLIKALFIKHYENVKEGNDRLARVVSNLGLSQEEFDKIQEIYEVTKKREGSSIPYPSVTKTKFRGRMLGADEYDNIVSGNKTTCCQRTGDWAEASAEHGSTEENGGIFVVEELDEKGKARRIIGQSWTWRNNSRICFDNIEIAEGIRQQLTVSEEKEILDIYIEVAKKMIEIDEKTMSKLLNSGEITQEIYDVCVLKEVTVGLNRYNDLGELEYRTKTGELRETSEIILPKEVDKKYEGLKQKRTLWLDSVEKQIVLYEMEREKKKEIARRILAKGEDQQGDVSLPFIYKNPREVYRYKLDDLTKVEVEKIKKIEAITFKEEQQVLQDCKYATDVAQAEKINPELSEVIISKNGDWYIIGEETDKEYYIADLAMIGGVNSQKNTEISVDAKRSTFEMTEVLYEKLLEMSEKDKLVRFEATRDTSYRNITRAMEKGLLEVIENEEAVFDDTGINMNIMSIKPNAEKIREELKKIKEVTSKLKKKEMLQTIPKNSDER